MTLSLFLDWRAPLVKNGAAWKGMLIFRYEPEGAGFPLVLWQVGGHFAEVNRAYCLENNWSLVFQVLIVGKGKSSYFH